jgi:pilus assembly protein Flp/PilA
MPIVKPDGDVPRRTNPQPKNRRESNRRAAVPQKRRHEMLALYSMVETWLRTRADSEEGQGLAEYGLILALVAVVAIVALTGLGSAIVSTLGSVTSSL